MLMYIEIDGDNFFVSSYPAFKSQLKKLLNQTDSSFKNLITLPNRSTIESNLIAVVMENIRTGVKLCARNLIMPVSCGLIVSYFMISHRINELISFVPSVQFFISVIVADRCRFPEGICEA